MSPAAIDCCALFIIIIIDDADDDDEEDDFFLSCLNFGYVKFLFSLCFTSLIITSHLTP